MLAHPLLVQIRRGWLGYAVALAAVALVSVLIGLVEGLVHLANISMLYLIAVLLVASALGSGPAVLASFASFLAFNWFFVEPFYTLTVADPTEWMALLLFLLTAIVTGQLAAGQRRRAQEAEQRQGETAVMYDIARLMTEPELDLALPQLAERLRQELELAAIVIEVLDENGQLTAKASAGEPDAVRFARQTLEGPSLLLGEGPTPTVSQRGAPGRWIKIMPPHPPGNIRPRPTGPLNVVPIKAQERRQGAMLVLRKPSGRGFGGADDRLLSAVASQLGVVIERAKLRQEATEAEILRRTDELKTALLNAVSHDLRTPLASIIASAGSLQQKDVAWTEKEKQEFAEAIEQEALRLNRIVSNLLDLSRIESGSLKPEIGWYDLGALIDDVLGRLRLLTGRHRTFANIPADLPPVPLDYVEIDQVLSNLIENAVKYGEPGSEIQVSAECKNGSVLVSVTNKGPMIPNSLITRLFEPFYRLPSKGPHPKGTGLGLAVARGLVEAHHGRIWAENVPGGGVKFAFSLPLDGAQGSPTSGTEKQS